MPNIPTRYPDSIPHSLSDLVVAATRSPDDNGGQQIASVASSESIPEALNRMVSPRRGRPPKFETRKAEAHKAKSKIDSNTIDAFEGRLELGDIVVDVMDNKSSYGDGAVEELAADLKYSVQTLYAYAAVARCWDLVDIKAAVARAPDILTFNHFVVTANTKMDKAARDRFINEAIEKEMSVSQLVEAKRDFLSVSSGGSVGGGRGSGGGGTGGGTPKPGATLKAMGDRTNWVCERLADFAPVEENIPALKKLMVNLESAAATAKARLAELESKAQNLQTSGNSNVGSVQ